jgi:hypothetical protein
VLCAHESLGYVSILGEAGVPAPGLEGGVGCNPRVTFDGKVRNLGPRTFCLRPPPNPCLHQQQINSFVVRLFPPPPFYCCQTRFSHSSLNHSPPLTLTNTPPTRSAHTSVLSVPPPSAPPPSCSSLTHHLQARYLLARRIVRR